MSRWDDFGFDNEKYNQTADNEETRLPEKFEEYKELEKREFDKRKVAQVGNIEKSGIFGRYFHTMALIQGIIIAGFTTSLLLLEFLSTDIKFSVLSLIVIILTGEIVIVSYCLRNKLQMNALKNSVRHFNDSTEFDGI